MEYTKLGRTGFDVSRIGLGCMSYGGGNLGGVNMDVLDCDALLAFATTTIERLGQSREGPTEFARLVQALAPTMEALPVNRGTLLGEPITEPLIAAAALMAAGVYLHLAEKHEHEHVHEPLFHEHRHLHDMHHQHAHAPSDPESEPHSHPHRHGPLVHKHPHYPDLHHRHEHA
jgi:hypothetical protein